LRHAWLTCFFNNLLNIMRVADCHYNIQETNKDISLNAIFQSKWKVCATVNAKKFSVYILVLLFVIFLAIHIFKLIFYEC